MKETHQHEITANLERAEESIQAARTLISTGHFDFAASRAYYAAFYAARAILLSEGLEFSRHSGVIAAIHQNFVKPRRLDQQYGKDLNWLFELRDIGDYGETRHVPQQDAERAIAAAAQFLKAIKELLNQS